MDDRFQRSEMLFGIGNMSVLKNSKIIVFGAGGVGGAVIEALARGGIGHIAVVDNDVIDITNLNRQILATEETVGMLKTHAAQLRIKSICPETVVEEYTLFYLPETADVIDLSSYDYIIDAIDNVTAKLELISRASTLGIPIISCMGTGNKIHPELFEITDISKTSVCPLARVIRRELRSRGINRLTVLYSKEEPFKPGSAVPASSSFTPPAAGYLIASKVIRDLLNLK